jgi:NAD(P)-dependent dehydrogenase (short-subunit alcohol dehydrogenase family)
MTAPYIILGAHGGIGWRLTEMLADDGHEILATARDASTIDNLAGYSSVATASLDITDTDAVEQRLADADQGEGFAGLAYCIGSIDLKPFKSTDDESYLHHYELNLLGAVRALRAAEKALKKAKGSVVLFSTIAVQQGFANHALISTAKGAVEGLTKALAAEWAPKVRVNCIAPSLTDTAIARPLTSSQQMADSIAAMHPIPRLGTPDDSAAMAKFLLTEDSGWITGQVLHVDGGRSTLRTKG